ncbi:MAG: hypothetical protein R3F59_03470 [Myxococcota bacterium]
MVSPNAPTEPRAPVRVNRPPVCADDRTIEDRPLVLASPPDVLSRVVRWLWPWMR